MTEFAVPAFKNPPIVPDPLPAPRETEKYVLYQALYSYNSGEDGDLVFDANDILRVTDEGTFSCTVLGSLPVCFGKCRVANGVARLGAEVVAGRPCK